MMLSGLACVRHSRGDGALDLRAAAGRAEIIMRATALHVSSLIQTP